MSHIDDARYERACMLVLRMCPNILRKVIHECMRKENIATFEKFLTVHKHSLFHLLLKRCCCSTKRTLPGQLCWWEVDRLFDRNSFSCLNGFDGNCPCKFDAKPGVSTSEMDVTMCCLVIKNLCASLSCTGTDLSHIRSILDIRNKLIHSFNASLDQPTYYKIWNKVRIAILELAKQVSRDLYSDASTEIKELESRVMNSHELEDLRKLIVDQKRIESLEKSTEELTNDVTEVNQKVEKLDKRIDQTKEKLVELEGDVRITKKKVTEIAEDRDKTANNVEQTNQKVSEIEYTVGKKIQTIVESEFSIVAQRMTNMEGKYDEVTQKVTLLEGEIEEHVDKSSQKWTQFEESFEIISQRVTSLERSAQLKAIDEPVKEVTKPAGNMGQIKQEVKQTSRNIETDFENNDKQSLQNIIQSEDTLDEGQSDESLKQTRQKWTHLEGDVDQESLHLHQADEDGEQKPQEVRHTKNNMGEISDKSILLVRVERTVTKQKGSLKRTLQEEEMLDEHSSDELIQKKGMQEGTNQEVTQLELGWNGIKTPTKTCSIMTATEANGICDKEALILTTEEDGKHDDLITHTRGYEEDRRHQTPYLLHKISAIEHSFEKASGLNRRLCLRETQKVLTRKEGISNNTRLQHPQQNFKTPNAKAQSKPQKGQGTQTHTMKI